MVKVYIKIDEKSNITEVGSSIFIKDTEGWIEIDEGSGDKYVHAQNNYLPGPTLDEEGRPNFVWTGGAIVPVGELDQQDPAYRPQD